MHGYILAIPWQRNYVSDLAPPFYLDLERYNTPDETGIQYGDAIGVEERTLQPDMCIKAARYVYQR